MIAEWLAKGGEEIDHIFVLDMVNEGDSAILTSIH